MTTSDVTGQQGRERTNHKNRNKKQRENSQQEKPSMKPSPDWGTLRFWEEWHSGGKDLMSDQQKNGGLQQSQQTEASIEIQLNMEEDARSVRAIGAIVELGGYTTGWNNVWKIV